MKRLRMAVHARIPWPMQPERKRLEALKALDEARQWHKRYEFNQKQSERAEKIISGLTEQNAEHRQEALKAINQANRWRAEADSILRAEKQAEGSC